VPGSAHGNIAALHIHIPLTQSIQIWHFGPGCLAPELLPRGPEATMATIAAYLHNLYHARANFAYSVPREFVRSCQTPMLVLPDDTSSHPL
jgi:hypothetical protein